MIDLYRQSLLEHYHHPHNWGLTKQATFAGRGVNQVCGDTISIQLDVDNQVIQAARFEGHGCAISIATASLLTDSITHKNMSEVAALNLADINRLLGIVITPARIKCALLALETIQQSLFS